MPHFKRVKISPVHGEIVNEQGRSRMYLRNGIKVTGNIKQLLDLASPVQGIRRKTWNVCDPKCVGMPCRNL